ncbi:hypothetical protein ACFE04_002350 [Oxalis oulophora]
MSCNGCRVLRKGCSETCILRPCLQWIDTAEAQGHATVFVAKFFGRAGLMSFISAVPYEQRPSLFQSLLYEACGRTINPVNGAVGLLWTGNWRVCQTAVETVLRGGTLQPLPELLNGNGVNILVTNDDSPSDETSEIEVEYTKNNKFQQLNNNNNNNNKRQRFSESLKKKNELDLCLMNQIRREGTPSMNSEESVTTTTACFDGGYGGGGGERKLLNLFV